MRSALDPRTLVLAASLVAACSTAASPEAVPPDEDAGAGPGHDAGPLDPPAGDAGPATSALMNDVSVLLPLPGSPAELDALLAPSSAGKGGALLAKSIYDAATQGDTDPSPDSLPNAPLTFTYDSLRMVAFRLDPCFAEHVPARPDESCQAQLRLVFQPLKSDGTTVTALDAAIHAFYALSRAELDDALAEIIAARKASDEDATGPLRVHPVVSKEGLSGPTAKAFLATVLGHAGASNLVRFTRFRVGNAGAMWTFSGFDLAQGKATPMIVPMVPDSATISTFSDPSNGDLHGALYPTSSSPDNLDVLVDLDRATAATDAARKAAYDSALRIENPAHHSPNTIDCATCHVAEIARVTVAEARFGLSDASNPNAYRPDGKIVSASDMAHTTTKPDPDGFSVHAFSYKGRYPAINQRVINETAAVVEALAR